MIKKTLTAVVSFLCIKGMAQNSPPKPDHVVIVVLENTAYGTIINSTKAPYLKSLANDPGNALFVNSFGMTHPSQPNYLYLFSGTNQGVTDNKLPAAAPFKTPNLGAELLKAGYTFAGYSEDLPSQGSTVEYYGSYARKHSPWVHWQGTGTNQIPSSCNKPFRDFPTDYSKLPTVSFVIPTLKNDMHDPPYTTEAIQNGDNWVKSNLGAYAEWAKTNNSLLIITWDEDDNNSNNQIVTMFIGQHVKGGKYTQKINHVNVLRTLEEMYGLGYAGNSANVSNVGDVWKSTVMDVQDNKPSLSDPLSIYPNPARGKISMHFTARRAQTVRVVLHDGLGRLVKTSNIDVTTGDNKLEIGNDADLSAGTYLVTLEAADNRYVKKVLVERE